MDNKKWHRINDLVYSQIGTGKHRPNGEEIRATHLCIKVENTIHSTRKDAEELAKKLQDFLNNEGNDVTIKSV